MYNLITIQILKNSPTARSMLAYNTYDEAISALYMTMASASANTEVTSCICTILSDDGSLNKQEIWERSQDNSAEDAE